MYFCFGFFYSCVPLAQEGAQFKRFLFCVVVGSTHMVSSNQKPFYVKSCGEVQLFTTRDSRELEPRV